MYRIRKYINLIVLKSLYYSLIYSHIVYAIQVWGSAKKSDLKKILTLQKKAVRMMNFKDQFPKLTGRLNSSNPLFVELGILKVSDVFTLQVSKFIFDCLTHNTPRIFWNWFILNHNVHDFGTRSNCDINVNVNNMFEIESVTETNILHTKSSKLCNYGAKLLKVAGPILWNSLPENIRNSQSVYKLKFLLKKFLLQQYEVNPEPLSNHYYVSNISFRYMKLVLSKMHTFFVPAYLPECIYKVKNISTDGLKFKIVRRSNFCIGGINYCTYSLCDSFSLCCSNEDRSSSSSNSSSSSSISSSSGSSGSGSSSSSSSDSN